MIKKIEIKKKFLWCTPVNSKMTATNALTLGLWCAVNFKEKCKINLEDGRLECLSKNDAIKYEKEYNK